MSSKSIYKLAVLAAVFAGGVLVANYASAVNEECHMLGTGSAVSEGYGASYDVIGSRGLLLKATCDLEADSLVYTVGSGSNSEYVYEDGYRWDGSNWQKYTLGGDKLAGTPWLKKQGNITLNVPAQEMINGSYYVGYVCIWDGSNWKCGCKDSTCSQGMWQLQQYQAELPGGPPSSSSSSSGGSSSGSTSGGGGDLSITSNEKSDITDTSATVTWTLNNPASGYIDYGINTQYGSVTPGETRLLDRHVQSLTGLQPGTRYYYRINSTDASGNTAQAYGAFNTADTTTGSSALSGNVGANSIAVSIPANAVDVTESPYNATGNGVTDDRAAIQSALSANPNATILLKDGTFLIGGTLLMGEGQTLLGSNAVVKAASGFTSHLVRTGGNNSTIKNIEFDGSDSATAGIYESTARQNTTIDRVTIHSVHGNATVPAWGIRMNGSDNAVISNSEIYDLGVYEDSIGGNSIGANRGILLVGTQRVTIEGNEIHNLEGVQDTDGIQALNSPGPTIIRNNIFCNIGKRGVKMQSGNMTVENNLYYDSGSVDFYEGGTPAVTQPNTLPAAQTIPHNPISSFGGYSNNVVRNNTIIVRRSHGALAGLGINGIIEGNYVDVYGYPSTSGQTQYGANSPSTNPVAMHGHMIWGGEHGNGSIRNNTMLSANIGILYYSPTGNTIQIQNNDILARHDLVKEHAVQSPNVSVSGTTDLSSRYAGYYRFNSLSGNKVFNFPTGNKTASIVSQGNTSVVPGVIGEALQMNSTAPYVDFTSANLTLSRGTTLSLWVKPDVAIGAGSSALYPGVFSSNANGSTNNYLSFERRTDGASVLTYKDANGTTIQSTPFTYSKNTWMHIALAIDTNGTLTFYVNGIPRGSGSGAVSIDLNYLGRGFSGATGDGGHRGSFDEVILYNDALSASEVAKIVNRRNPTVEVGN